MAAAHRVSSAATSGRGGEAGELGIGQQLAQRGHPPVVLVEGAVEGGEAAAVEQRRGRSEQIGEAGLRGPLRGGQPCGVGSGAGAQLVGLGRGERLAACRGLGEPADPAGQIGVAPAGRLELAVDLGEVGGARRALGRARLQLLPVGGQLRGCLLALGDERGQPGLGRLQPAASSAVARVAVRRRGQGPDLVGGGRAPGLRAECGQLLLLPADLLRRESCRVPRRIGGVVGGAARRPP